jgi:hypothetical protein
MEGGDIVWNIQRQGGRILVAGCTRVFFLLLYQMIYMGVEMNFDLSDLLE